MPAANCIAVMHRTLRMNPVVLGLLIARSETLYLAHVKEPVMRRLLGFLIAGLLPSHACATNAVVADANQRVLGLYVGQFAGVRSDQVKVISSKGFTAIYDRNTGQIVSAVQDPWGNTGAGTSELFFSSADCSGTRYAEAPTGFTGGGVGRVGSSSQLIYIEKNAPRVAFTSASRLTAGGVCEPGNFFPGPFVEAKPNDPTVTGISNEPATAPLKIEVASIGGSSFDVFRNGFERESPAASA